MSVETRSMMDAGVPGHDDAGVSRHDDAPVRAHDRSARAQGVAPGYRIAPRAGLPVLLLPRIVGARDERPGRARRGPAGKST